MSTLDTVLIVVFCIFAILSAAFSYMSAFKFEKLMSWIGNYRHWKEMRRLQKIYTVIWDHKRWEGKSTKERDNYIKKRFKFSDEEWITFCNDFNWSLDKVHDKLEKKFKESLTSENVTSLETYRRIKDLEKIKEERRRV